MNRLELLDDLVKFRKGIAILIEELSTLDWDYDGSPLVVNNIDIKNVIQRYILGDCSAVELENWANLIECREDLQLEEFASDIIYQLANPILEGEITHQSCKETLQTWDSHKNLSNK